MSGNNLLKTLEDIDIKISKKVKIIPIGAGILEDNINNPEN